ncbi:FAD-binding domain-containing protein [Hyaloscypha variabilis F]|uniref:FAD-binding domain-containing protein n=1 Tax=Hyaloscypha variabilis (strain UAMH 11265 / GT02V1 / F) TaxID=1149755 RepID=A0A2J6QW52_HYAVF|nr:FAD-binding domain-containing protein [Hyaloscypha variabilis F]
MTSTSRLLVHGVQGAATCKSTPSSPTWPSPAIWDQLNQTTGGQLLQPVPPGAVCHPGHSSYNATNCVYVQYAWSNEYFHQRDPVSVEWNNWNNDSCLPDPDVPCSSAGYPLYVINATTPEHVQAGVNFAKANNIRLIVKNSGHDYVGRSSGSNALSIWVHHMKGITIHETGFQPQHCNLVIDGVAITAGGGTQMLEAYRETAAINYTVVGGGGRTVALGGFLTGAGHSILSPHYGLATDQVLEMEIVTPTGDHLVLNECQNTDLFWAMRGGGGSTFGIMTSVTMKAYPSPSILSMSFGIETSATNPHAFDMVAYMLGQFPSLMEAGVSGYPIILKASPSILGNTTVYTSGMIGKFMMLNSTNTTDMATLFEPIFDHINSTWPGSFVIGVNITSYPSFYSWYEENYDGSPVGYENVMGSRLLDEAALSANATATKLAFEQFAGGDLTTAYIVSGKGVWNAQPRGGSNAVLPAWRKSIVHATTTVAFAPLNATAEQAAINATQLSTSGLRVLAPNTGAYMNEKGAGRYEPNWQQTFWGENYARLLQIKRTVDPDDVLWCNPCVGNERWHEVDNVLCQV